MNPYQRDFPIDDRPETWHDEAAQKDALEALSKRDLPELERIFHEARGISFYRIIEEIIRDRL